MLVQELFEAISTSGVEALTKKLGQKTNKYRQFKDNKTLRGIQSVENKIEKKLSEATEKEKLGKMNDLQLATHFVNKATSQGSDDKSSVKFHAVATAKRHGYPDDHYWKQIEKHVIY